ncbi:MAG: hypothetical protein JO210_16610 [Acidobacteriaceae bacterium]|nr:hypothetical protein [Acidobacteriaceae bacterium]
MQRLFSTFADGWPGAGLLLQRMLAGSMLLYEGLLRISVKPYDASTIPGLTGAAAGCFLIAGLWTPLAGLTSSLVELWSFLAGTASLTAVASGLLGGTIAMIGPGAWSVDARLFGRKHIHAGTLTQRSLPGSPTSRASGPTDGKQDSR